MFKRKFITFLLVLSLITPAFYLPQITPKAEAFLGFGDLVIDVKALAERIVDGIAMAMAQQIVDRMVASTVKWAQSGFEGNPAYVTDPKQYFGSIADGVAGQFIKDDPALGFLCSPFQANIRLSLAQNYYEPEPFQCTITGVGGNIAGFYSDFSQGGWDTWFSMTQNPTNNPYGAYLAAKIELDSRIAKALGVEEKQLDWSQGFMSWQDCITYEDVYTTDSSGNTSRKNGKCVVKGPVKTPGSAIKEQLDQSLSAPLQKLITAQHIDQLVSGFTTGLLQKFVFGSKGLFARDNKISDNPATQGAKDIDGDGITDGFDVDSNGSLDVCKFGGAGKTAGPPCKGSLGYIDEVKDRKPPQNPDGTPVVDPDSPTYPYPTPPEGTVPPEAGNWSTDQWKSQLDSILASKGVSGSWSYEALSATRADLNALGADWQFTSTGALKPRLYLPTPNGGPLTGDFSRVVDVSDSNASPGTPWRWIVR